MLFWFMIGVLFGVAVTTLVVSALAFWWTSATADHVQDFDDLEGEGRG